MSSPSHSTLLQRDETGRAQLPVSGEWNGTADTVQARLVALRADGTDAAQDGNWVTIDDNPQGGNYEGSLTAEQGWYRLEVRALGDGATTAQIHGKRVGVGDVFITAGQSNSANLGDTTHTATDGRVLAWDGTRWIHSADPQPIADGGGGAVWSHLGDAWVDAHDVPVGFASVGFGGTRVCQWQPNGPCSVPRGSQGPLYERLRSVIRQLGAGGFRAILWHQGESDADANTSAEDYHAGLEAIIAQSRVDAGHDVPWYVAQASFLPRNDADAMTEVCDGQRLVITSDPNVFQGPTTDDLTGSGCRYDNVHFTQSGMQHHAARWLNVLMATEPVEPYSSSAPPAQGCPGTGE